MQIDKLIELSEKKTELLKELKQSLIYEQSVYDVRRCNKDTFMLFEISTHKIVRSGNAEYIHKWLQRRKIKPELVYNYELLN